jgi:hypothetical protein
LGKLANEFLLTSAVQRRVMAFRLASDQAGRSAAFMGGKDAVRAFKKLMRELEE